VLDFGAATGELFDLLATHGDYHFVESNDTLARALARRIPLAKREERTALPHAHFGTVFALDSLEHNDDAPRILDELVASLRIGGHLIVSGPTENRLYRLGRRIAGFQGHYHRANIYQLEGAIRERFEFVRLRAIPAGIPLFRVSVWKRAEP
jgi:2-polyprenyl-3-methyl-5-hydroxy-6-metoxy-1,4-benzoquinol methylase